MSRTSHHNPNSDSSFDLSYHVEMVSDHERVSQIKAAIDFYANPEHIFCELGCGTGIFSIYAAQKFKHVYAIDIDANVLAIARANARRLGLEDRITFVEQDALNYLLPEGVSADVILSENMSTWMATEPQVKMVNHAISHLSNGNTKYIPQRIINLMELAQINWNFGELQIKGALPQFTGFKAPRIITESRAVFNVDLTKRNQLDVSIAEIRYQALVGGEINCARIFCIVEFAPKVLFFTTDSLMPVTIIPIQNEEIFEVEAGDLISASVDYQFNKPIDDISIVLRKL